MLNGKDNIFKSNQKKWFVIGIMTFNFPYHFFQIPGY